MKNKRLWICDCSLMVELWFVFGLFFKHRPHMPAQRKKLEQVSLSAANTEL